MEPDPFFPQPRLLRPRRRHPGAPATSPRQPRRRELLPEPETTMEPELGWVRVVTLA